MKFAALAALMLGAAAIPAAANAQAAQINQTIAGTRLDISATGEATRVPDVAVISAGVTTRAATAGAAIRDAAARMQRVRAELKKAGIADRDIQTSTISLNPDYVYENNQPPKLTGYNASNQLTVRFRDIRAGTILDALVASRRRSDQRSQPWSSTIPTPALRRSPRQGYRHGPRPGRSLCARSLGCA